MPSTDVAAARSSRKMRLLVAPYAMKRKKEKYRGLEKEGI